MKSLIDLVTLVLAFVSFWIGFTAVLLIITSFCTKHWFGKRLYKIIWLPDRIKIGGK